MRFMLGDTGVFTGEREPGIWPPSRLEVVLIAGFITFVSGLIAALLFYGA